MAFTNIIDIIYPKGSTYQSTQSTSPAVLFGGTWSQIKDRFLVGAGSSYSVTATGGEATHTLTEDEMPSHSHEWKAGYFNGSAGETYSYARYPLRLAEDKAANWWSSEAMGNENAGGGQAHNNLPPYYAVYIWVRTV